MSKRDSSGNKDWYRSRASFSGGDLVAVKPPGQYLAMR